MNKLKTQHSPEPWSFTGKVYSENSGQYNQILSDDGNEVISQDGYTSEDDCQRIVACVNACAALSTPVLQQAVFTDMTVDYVLKCAEAKRQIAELKALLFIAVCPCCDGSGSFPDGYGAACQCQFCYERTSALAKAGAA